MVKSTDSNGCSINEEKKSEKPMGISNKADEGEHEPGMRVGEDYQAEIPEKLADVLLNEKDLRPEPILIWAPVEEKLPDPRLDNYLKVAKDQYGYNVEQALGMLYWHSYESEKAIDDLRNFTPLPDEWSMEDKVIFEQSFSSYGKSFPRIRQQLPDKSIGALVKYYYTWKKNRNKKSLMDKGERKDLGLITRIFADDSNGENDSSDSDYEPADKKVKVVEKNGEKIPIIPSENKQSPALSTNCVNCAGVTPQMNPTPKGKLCMPCYEYWRRTGIMGSKDKDSQVTLYHGPPHKMKRKPPKGMQLSEEALNAAGQTHGDSHIRPLQVELINLKRLLITNEQNAQEWNEKIQERAVRIEPAAKFHQTLNPRWTNEELLVAVQCVRKYGKEFNAMCEVLGNKNASHCRNFFINYHRRFNLMDVLAEYEKENNIPHSESRVNEAWVEVAEAERECKVVCSDSQVTYQPPPLRRQNENTPIPIIDTPSFHGPPPLVNSNLNPIVPSTS